jgi:hypothetical protein
MAASQKKQILLKYLKLVFDVNLALRYKVYAKLKKLNVSEEVENNTKSSEIPEKIKKVSNPNLSANVAASGSDPVDATETTIRSPRVNILAGPTAKAEIGSSVNRFAQRLKEQKEKEGSLGTRSDEKSTEIKSYQIERPNRQDSNLFPEGAEVKQFFARKTELAALTANKKDMLAEKHIIPSLDRDRSNTEVIALSKQPIQTNATPLIINVGTSNSMESIPDQKDSAKDLNSPSAEKQADVKLETQEQPVPAEKPTTTKTGKKKSVEKLESREDDRIESPVEGAEIPFGSEENITSPDEASPSAELVVPVGDAEITPSQPSPPPIANDAHGKPDVSQNVKFLPSLVTTNIFARLAQNGILRCRFTRKKSLLGKGPPTYLLHNEADNAFLLAARKVLMSKQIYYVISSNPEDFSKDSPNCVAKLKYFCLTQV